MGLRGKVRHDGRYVILPGKLRHRPGTIKGGGCANLIRLSAYSWFRVHYEVCTSPANTLDDRLRVGSGGKSRAELLSSRTK